MKHTHTKWFNSQLVTQQEMDEIRGNMKKRKADGEDKVSRRTEGLYALHSDESHDIILRPSKYTKLTNYNHN